MGNSKGCGRFQSADFNFNLRKEYLRKLKVMTCLINKWIGLGCRNWILGRSERLTVRAAFLPRKNGQAVANEWEEGVD